MSMIIDGTAGLTFNNATTQASAGVVLQVVQATSVGSASTSSSTYVTTGYLCSITPKFTTSKILILTTCPSYNGTSSTTNRVAIYRGGSAICESQISFNGAGATGASGAINYLDFPATTSSTTYTLYFKTSGGTMFLNSDGASIITITLMEIAG